MPTLPTYISQGSVAATTGQPETPMGLASQNALTQGADTASAKFAHLAYIDSIRENAQQQAEQTTVANQLLLNHDRQLTDLATGLASPEVNSTPQDKKAYFLQRTKELEAEVLDNAAKVGGIAQQYATTHLRSVSDPHLQRFGTAMDTLRNELGQVDLMHSVQADVDRAIEQNLDPKPILRDAFQRLRMGVAAKFLTGEQATIFINNESKRLGFEQNKKRATSDPVGFLTQASTGVVEGVPREAMPALEEAARHALAFEQGQQDRVRKEAERVQKEGEEVNLKQGEVAIVNGDLANTAHLLEYASKNPLSASGFHTLDVMLKNKTQGATSDPTTLAKLYERLGNPDPKKWPTRSEVEHLMDPTFGPPKLSMEHGVSIFNHLRTYHDEIRKEGITRYRQEGTDAEEQIKNAFKPAVGGLLDYDKLAGTYQARALRAHQDNWLKYKDAENRPDPMSWVDGIVNPYLVALARDGRTLATSNLLRQGIPIEMDTVDKVLQARKEGKIDARQAESATQWLRLMDTFEAMESLKTKSSSTPSETGGVKRNR